MRQDVPGYRRYLVVREAQIQRPFHTGEDVAIHEPENRHVSRDGSEECSQFAHKLRVPLAHCAHEKGVEYLFNPGVKAPRSVSAL